MNIIVWTSNLRNIVGDAMYTVKNGGQNLWIEAAFEGYQRIAGLVLHTICLANSQKSILLGLGEQKAIFDPTLPA